jgi:penicillin V acylase-like amidase (Ntn superfamily)
MCSSFVLKNRDKFVFGFNHDSPDRHFYIMTNTRNIAKKALVDDKNPAAWISKYGSITLNKSKEFPSAGMNEKGLSISVLLLLNGGELPMADKRKAVDLFITWAQYQLDCSASVEEVIATNKNIRPYSNDIEQVHFLVSDRAGNVAVIEFLRGEMIVHTGEELPVSLITNYKYDSEIKKLFGFMKFQDDNDFSYLGKEPINMDTWEKSNINDGDVRSVLGTILLKKYQKNKNQSLIFNAFDILKSLHFYSKSANRFFNQFSVVFDSVNMQIYYSTKVNAIIRKLDFADFDLTTPSLGVMCSMDKNVSDVKKDFIPFSKTLNKKNLELLLESNIEFHKLLEFPVSDFDYRRMKLKFSELAKYPDAFQFSHNS